MRLIAQAVLADALKKHADARKWIAAWTAVVEDAQWTSIDEVRKRYPTADGVKLRSDAVITVFNVRGNSYRLLTNIKYDQQVVQVLELLTHAEYDKQTWKARY